MNDPQDQESINDSCQESQESLTYEGVESHCDIDTTSAIFGDWDVA